MKRKFCAENVSPYFKNLLILKSYLKPIFVTLKEFSVNLGSHDDIDNVRMYGKIISKYGPTSSLLSLEAK